MTHNDPPPATERHLVESQPLGGAPRGCWILLALILLLAAILRWLGFVGFVSSDPAAYSSFAHQIATGTWEVGNHRGAPPVFSLRLGLILPTALMFRTFGVSEAAMLLPVWVLSMASVIVAYAGGRYMGTWRTGLIAAFLLAIIPLEIQSATNLVPDGPASFWGAVAALGLLWSIERRTRLAMTGAGFLAGLCLGVAWLTKESTAYLFPVLGVFSVLIMIRKRSSVWAVVAFAAAALLVALLEGLFYLHTVGNPLFRVTEISRSNILCADFFFSENAKFGYPTGGYWPALWRRLFVSGPNAICFNPIMAHVPLIAIIALFPAFRSGSRRVRAIAIWFLGLLLFYNFGTMSFRYWQPLVIDKGSADRYLQPLVMPAVLLTAWWLSRSLFDRAGLRLPRAISLLCAGAIVASSASASVRVVRDRGKQALAGREASKRLKPDSLIYTDERTKWILRFFWNYPKSINSWSFAELEAREIPFKSHVLMDRRQTMIMPNLAPRFAQQIPDWWETVLSSGDVSLYWVPEEHGHPDAYSPVPVAVPGASLTFGKPVDASTSGSIRIDKHGDYSAFISLPRHVTRATFNFSDFAPEGTTPRVALRVRNKTGPYELFSFHPYGFLDARDTHSFRTDIPKGDYILQVVFFGGGSASFVLNSIEFE